MAKLTEPKLVQMSTEMLRTIDELADRRGLSASAIIRLAVSRLLEEESRVKTNANSGLD